MSDFEDGEIPSDSDDNGKNDEAPYNPLERPAPRPQQERLHLMQVSQNGRISQQHTLVIKNCHVSFCF